MTEVKTDAFGRLITRSPSPEDASSSRRRRRSRSPEEKLLAGSFLSLGGFVEAEELEDAAPEEASSKYQEYVGKYRKKNVRKFFEKHSKQDWMRERYDPSHVQWQAWFGGLRGYEFESKSGQEPPKLKDSLQARHSAFCSFFDKVVQHDSNSNTLLNSP